MEFTAVGDILIQRHFEGDYEGFSEVRNYIQKGDFRFCNLETTVHREGECFASQFSGGSYLRVDPEAMEFLTACGFNGVNCANNHALDYSFDGLLKTIENLRNYGFRAAGVGENLAQAAAPVYIDTPKGRVALIGIVSTKDQPALMAGEQSPRVKGRPGVNGYRFKHSYIVDKKYLDVIRELGRITEANSKRETIRGEGYLPALPENTVEFDTILFEAGDTPGQKFVLNKNDLERLKKNIFEAKLQADYIFVSVHLHEQGKDKQSSPSYMQEFARTIIDYGADGIIGHGPHLLRGIEIYKNKPIFYSLGDFVLQTDNMPYVPADFFEKYGLPITETTHKALAVRSNNFTRGLSADKVMFETVIPYWKMEDGKLTHLELMPVCLKFGVPKSRYGLPEISKDMTILERLAKLSEEYGTKIEIKDGVGVVSL